MRTGVAEGNSEIEDEIADIEDFFVPIRRAIVPMFAEFSGLDGSRWAGAVASKERL